MAAGPAAREGDGVVVAATVCVGVGEADATGLGVALGVARGLAVAFGTNNRPRRCDAVGKADADDVGVAVAADVGDRSDGVTLRGVIFGSRVDVGVADGAFVGNCSTESAFRGVAFGSGDIVADGNGVAATDVDEAGVSEPSEAAVVVAAAFTNFFDGAFDGGVASAFIFSRVFLASS